MVRVELWPHGNESRKKALGTALISNDGTGTLARGNYRFQVSGARGKLLKKGQGEVKDFPRRRLHAWHLVKRVLQEVLR